MFPISKTLGNKLALLVHFKQSLSRNKLFNEIKLRLESKIEAQ